MSIHTTANSILEISSIKSLEFLGLNRLSDEELIAIDQLRQTKDPVFMTYENYDKERLTNLFCFLSASFIATGIDNVVVANLINDSIEMKTATRCSQILEALAEKSKYEKTDFSSKGLHVQHPSLNMNVLNSYYKRNSTATIRNIFNAKTFEKVIHGYPDQTSFLFLINGIDFYEGQKEIDSIKELQDFVNRIPHMAITKKQRPPTNRRILVVAPKVKISEKEINPIQDTKKEEPKPVKYKPEAGFQTAEVNTNQNNNFS